MRGVVCPFGEVAILALAMVSAGPGQAAVKAQAQLPAKLPPFSAAAALHDTEMLLSFGERQPGTPGHQKARDYLSARLRAIPEMAVRTFPFTAKTPRRELAMVNLAGVLAGGKKLGVISCHYDTVRLPGRVFVGANDAAVACGAVLSLARSLAVAPRLLTLWFLFYDGEEALERWSETDGLYGSRWQAEYFRKQGLLPNIAFAVNLDMIGDRELSLARDLFSDPVLLTRAEAVARRLGLADKFFRYALPIDDDHRPLARLGVPALDLIDFQFGPGPAPGGYWHTPQDTLDKLAGESVEAVGRVALELIGELSGAAAQGVKR